MTDTKLGDNKSATAKAKKFKLPIGKKQDGKALALREEPESRFD